ncbi:hypothetical protein Ancab_016275 [Ancistrocladus abbreviatus]
MAFRRDLPNKRLFILTSPTVPPNATRYNFHREYVTSPDARNRGFYRRFFQWRAINQSSSSRFPEFLSLPVGDKLRETLRGLSIAGDRRIQFQDLAPPPPSMAIPGGGHHSGGGLAVEDARKILRASVMEKLKVKLREAPEKTVSYSEFVRICVNGCGNEAQGLEFAKLLDDSGNVIVLGNIVLLHPEQVVRSMESLISQSMSTTNDPRKKELEELEKQKAEIDKKARELVQRELYCGLGLLMAQTLGFMRLTFWELSWDVMEPICFFVTSLHFALAYGFFLRTSTEPSFEGYFQRRFKAKQKKLMKMQGFNIEKYNQLCKAFYPSMKPHHVLAGGSEYLTVSDHTNRVGLAALRGQGY